MKPQQPHMPAVPIVIILLAAAALWVTAASGRSLWIDEFHGLHHERAADLSTFFESVRADNHPPLAFLVVRASRSLFGESPLALRLPSILCGLALLIVVVRFCRNRLTPVLLLASSYSLMIITEARMYPLLALAATGLMVSASNAAAGRVRALPLMMWTAVGLHSHYYFVYSLAVIVGWLVVRAFVAPTARSELTRALAWIAAGCLLFLPWILYGFVEQLHHGLPPGRTHISPRFYLQSLLHLFFINVRVGGELVRGVAFAGAVPAAMLLALGSWRALTGRSTVRESRLVFSLCFAAPLLAMAAALIAPRAGYNWRYVAASLAPACILVADAASGSRWFGRAAAAVLVAAMGLVTVVNVGSPGREDNAGAVRYIVERYRAGDAVLVHAVENPGGARTIDTWDYYAERDPEAERARKIPALPLAEYEQVLEHPRVWVFLRTAFPDRARIPLEKSYPTKRKMTFGADRQVILFER